MGEVRRLSDAVDRPYFDRSVVMDQPATKLARNASAAILFPIAGLLGGIFVGTLRATTKGPDELRKILCALKWGTAGFFLGLFLIVLLSLNLRGKNIVSVRRLMAFIAIAGLLSWYLTRILFGVIGSEGF
jgi:hypothetical protein